MASNPVVRGEYSVLEYKVLIYSDKYPNGEEVYSAGNCKFDSQGYVSAEQGVGLERMKAFCEQTAKEIAEENGIAYGGIEEIEADEEEPPEAPDAHLESDYEDRVSGTED